MISGVGWLCDLWVNSWTVSSFDWGEEWDGVSPILKAYKIIFTTC
jgi:hypothetical protein